MSKGGTGTGSVSPIAGFAAFMRRFEKELLLLLLTSGLPREVVASGLPRDVKELLEDPVDKATE